ASGSTFSIGTETQSFTLTDASGNAVSCSFDITVNDTESPVLSCPSNISVSTDPGSCDAVVNFNITTSDNCPGAVLNQTAGLGTGSTFPLGTTVETYTLTDASSNVASCSFNVIVTDDEDPVLICPTNITQVAAMGDCDAVISYAAVTATDNCSAVTPMQTAGLGSGATFPVGTTTETYEVSDAAGNMVSCSFDITILDTEDPVIVCPAPITAVADPGTCGTIVTYTGVGAGDNCTPVVVNLISGLGTGATFPVGSTTETYQAIDPSGNTATCSFTVLVLDNENPTISCPADITVSNDAGNCDAVVNYTPPVGMDNCPGAVTTLDAGIGSGGTFPVGTSTETYLVTDGSGNTATCSFTVTVNDTEAPTLTCPPNQTVTAPLNICSATVTYGGVGAADNCPGIVIVSLTGGLPSGSAFPTGTTTVTYQGVDSEGNIGTCSFDITVDANPPATTPVINLATNMVCVGDTLQLSANAPAIGETGMWTGGPTGGVFIPSASDPNAQLVNLLVDGNFDLYWNISNACDTQTDTVNVQVNPLPSGVITDPPLNPISANGVCDGELGVIPLNGTPPYVGFQWDDMMMQTTQIASNLCAGPISVVITDAAGCMSAPITYTLTEPPANTVSVDLTVILQTAYDDAAGLMDDKLRGLTGAMGTNPFPTSDPYPALGFPQLNTSSAVATTAPILTTTGNTAVVDWVSIELRDKNDPSMVLARQPALVLRNGKVVDAADGTSTVSIQVPDDDYYIAIRHRNHLGVMTFDPVALSSVTTGAVDFTNILTQTYQSAIDPQDPQVVLPDGKLGLWGGDADGNKEVFYSGGLSDIVPVSFLVLTDPNNVTFSFLFQVDGYNTEDLDLSGAVNFAGGNSEVNVISINIFTHPQNTAFSFLFSIEEQIP
ncbi:MAG: HYR domain-containing protein, partial [Bacteroidota bacterium]